MCCSIYRYALVSSSMQGKKQRTPKIFYQFSLEEAVPAEHPLRRIEQALDLRFLYKQTRRLYGTDGQQSIDPVVFFKMCLVGYLNNITSDRALYRYCSDSLAARWFLCYDIDEPLPVHSTLSRTRALFGLDLYLEVFGQVLAMCVDSGLVSGKRQAVDSGLIKANASVDSMQRVVIMEDAGQYCRQVYQVNEEGDGDSDSNPGDTKSLKSVSRPDPPPQTKRRRSNKTHSSASDPDARMARKPGKPTDMYYHGQISVDAQHGVIVAGMADYSDRDDHRSLPKLLDQIQTHLSKHHLRAEELLADSKYNTLHTIAACEKGQITAYMPNPSGYKREREGFTYDRLTDSYRCSRGVILPYKGKRKCRTYYNKIYTSSTKDCTQCPLRAQCLTGKKPYKTLTHSTGKALYDGMDERLKTPYGRRMLSRRKGIVEPVIGHLLHHNGMKKVYARGLAAANKHVLMACISFNLKKWLKYSVINPLGTSAAMGKVYLNAISQKIATRTAHFWKNSIINQLQTQRLGKEAFDTLIFV